MSTQQASMEGTPSYPKGYRKTIEQLDQQRGTVLDGELFKQIKDFIIHIQSVLEENDGVIKAQNRNISVLADENANLKAYVHDVSNSVAGKMKSSQIEELSQMAEKMKIQSQEIAQLNNENAELKQNLQAMKPAESAPCTSGSGESQGLFGWLPTVPSLMSWASPVPLQRPVSISPALYKKEPYHSLMTQFLHKCSHTGAMKPHGRGDARDGVDGMEVTGAEEANEASPGARPGASPGASPGAAHQVAVEAQDHVAAEGGTGEPFEKIGKDEIARSANKQVDDEVVILPCVIASRVGSDLGAIFQAAGLDKTVYHPDVIMVVFIPKAHHVPEYVVSTFDSMSDEFKVKDMVDVYFYDDEIYKCDANSRAVKKMKEILK